MRRAFRKDLILFESLNDPDSCIILRVLEENNRLLFFSRGKRIIQGLFGKIEEGMFCNLTDQEKQILSMLEQIQVFANSKKANMQEPKNLSNAIATLNGNVFTHFSHRLDRDEANRTLPAGYQLGYDGLTVDLD